jgi:ribonuclease E
VRQLRLRDIGGIIVVDFIDMVLESNRDLVLRRLTEALARDRTRHQVSEVTSLGLVQLTRKKLGTGLIEAFSTNCTHCNGRGIVIHGDPVDSGSSNSGRKSEPGTAGGRRGKRGKKGAPPAEEVAVAKVPAHGANEHPMFKAMAAANGRHEDDETDGEVGDDEALVVVGGDGSEQVAKHRAPDADDDGDFDESEDTDEDDTDAENLDDDDDEDDIDDDIEVIASGDEDDDDDSDEDDDSDDEDDDDSDDEDDDDEDEDDDDSDDEDSDDDEDEDDSDDEEFVAAPSRPRRRRAAARPAGPPVS